MDIPTRTKLGRKRTLIVFRADRITALEAQLEAQERAVEKFLTGLMKLADELRLDLRKVRPRKKERA